MEYEITDINTIDVGDLIGYKGEKYVCVQTRETEDQWYTIIYTIKESDYEKYKGKTLGINDPVFKILAYQDICDDTILNYEYTMIEKKKYTDIQTLIKLGD